MWSKWDLSPADKAQAATGSARLSQRVGLAIVLVVVVFGAWLRIASIDGVFLQGDEYHSLKLMPRSYLEILSSYDNRGSGIALPLLQRLGADLLGYNLWAVRWPALVGSLALIFCFYPLSRSIVGRTGAAAGTVLATSSSALIYHGHFARSYSVAACLALVLVCGLQRCAQGQRLTASRAAIIVLLFALLPYVHLASLSVTLPACAGLGIALALDPTRRGELRRFALTLAAGVVAAVLLYLPAWSSFWSFIESKTTQEYSGAFGVLDVAGVLAGSRMGGVLFLLLGCAALVLLFRRWGRVASPLIFACLGPWVALLLLRPYGDAYAYARYALFALPCWFIAMGWLIGERFAAKGEAESAVSLTGVLVSVMLAAVVSAAGPLGVDRVGDGPYASSYMNLYGLPAFDASYPGASPVYARLARASEPLRIIEAPRIMNRGLHLYRNYYLQHGHETRLGVLRAGEDPEPSGAGVSLLGFEWQRSDPADFLILHRNLPAEVRGYWEWVYRDDAEPSPDPTVNVLMERHASNWSRQWVIPDASMLRHFEDALGAPAYDDAQVIVWSLRGAVLP